MLRPVHIVRLSGEITLKSERTRPIFERTLLKNIEYALRKHGFTNYKIRTVPGRIFIYEAEGAENILTRVFGVHSVSPAVEYMFSDLEDLAAKAEEYFKDFVKGKTFAVRPHRFGSHDFTSMDIAKVVGAKLKPYSKGVDLENPEVEVFIEVRGNRVYFFKEIIKGPMGLPIGTNGYVLALVSGGFDSPVAVWYTWKRGVKVDIVHFDLAGPVQVYHALRVIKKLVDNWCYGYEPKVIIVDFKPIVRLILERIKQSLKQVVLKRLMYRAASLLADRLGAEALVTGESLGQVSSQTLRSLWVSEKASKYVILRPLLGFDKEEIIAKSRELGLYDLSSKVKEFCALVRGAVATWPEVEEVDNEETKIPFDEIIEAVENAKVYRVSEIKLEELLPTESLEIDFIPEGAILIDVRSRKEYEEWHPPGALHIDDVDFDRMDKDKVIITYCDKGVISLILAKQLRNQGFRAFSLRGGLKKLKSCPLTI